MSSLGLSQLLNLQCNTQKTNIIITKIVTSFQKGLFPLFYLIMKNHPKNTFLLSFCIIIEAFQLLIFPFQSRVIKNI